MKNSAFLLCLAFFIGSCQNFKKITENFRGIEQSVAEVKDGFLQIKDELVPLDSATQNATGGILAGLLDSLSQEQLDSIGSRMNKALVVYLNRAIDSLHIDSIGFELLAGVQANLFSDQTESEIDSFLKHLISEAGSSLDHTLDRSLESLISDDNKESLGQLLTGILSQENLDSLSARINQSLGNIRLDSITVQLALLLEDERVGKAIDTIGINLVNSIQGATNEGDWFSETGKQILWGIGALAAVIATIIYFLRRHLVREKNQTEQSLALLFRKIEEMSDHEDIRKLKLSIKEDARSIGINHQIEKMMDKFEIKK